MDFNDPCLQVDGSCTVRLHVGGLGPSVISSDLVQIFSSLAKVLCVDLVNTKGRNFAYVTIEAASRDIKRLFSLYNGCVWKGGRLKMEKAKEFYLDKLHREWADRDCLQAIQTPKLNCLTTASSDMKSKDSSSLKIYMPKLRKVKAIPEKGLGKHKRSFVRVDPLPYSLLQVCNCDQHCTTTSKYQSRTGKEPLGMAEEEGIQDSKHATIKASTNEISTECESFFKASGYKGRKGLEKKRGIYQKSGYGQGSNEVPAIDEPVLNISEKGDTECITNIDEPVLNMTGFNDFCHGKTQGLVEEEDAIGKNAPGRSWVQKASWKSLVGETGRMSFSLGTMLNLNAQSLAAPKAMN